MTLRRFATYAACPIFRTRPEAEISVFAFASDTARCRRLQPPPATAYDACCYRCSLSHASRGHAAYDVILPQLMSRHATARLLFLY